MIRKKYAEIKPKLDRAAYKIGETQAKIFLTIFYYTIVPIAFSYLKISKEIHHKKTGHFKQSTENHNKLQEHKKQF